MTPEEFRIAFMKSRGLSLDGTPIPQIPVQTVPITPTDEPIRMPNPEAVAAWRAGANQDIANGVVGTPSVPPMPAVPPVKPPAVFPPDAAPAVPYTQPAVAQTGTTLTSTPMDPNAGWAGSIGMPGTPAEAYKLGGDREKLLSGLDEIAKGMKGKAPVDPGASIITPMTSQPNQPNQLAYQLMAGLRRNRGLTLTGQ